VVLDFLQSCLDRENEDSQRADDRAEGFLCRFCRPTKTFSKVEDLARHLDDHLGIVCVLSDLSIPSVLASIRNVSVASIATCV